MIYIVRKNETKIIMLIISTKSTTTTKMSHIVYLNSECSLVKTKPYTVGGSRKTKQRRVKSTRRRHKKSTRRRRRTPKH